MYPSAIELIYFHLPFRAALISTYNAGLIPFLRSFPIPAARSPLIF